MAVRPVLAVDLDECLGQFVAGMCAHVNEKYGATQSVDEFFSYHFADVWKCSDAEALERVHSFFESDLFVNLALVEGCKEALAALQPHFSLALVTSRQHAIQEVTEKWLEKNFPGVFDRILFGNHYGVSGATRTKADMCSEVGAVALIDDSVKYAVECSAVLEKVLLFGNYAWNEASSLPANVIRVPDWSAVLSTLLP